jgi:hypothetical protein
MKSLFLILVLLALLAATLWWAIYAWTSVDVEMTIGTRVNEPENDDPSLLDRVAEPTDWQAPLLITPEG